jgi:hypothetical protein
MSQFVKAIYENGLFRPLDPVSLPDREAVCLIIQTTPPRSSAPGPDVEFELEAAGLLFDGPSLPAEFSRADIYADHA